MQQLSEKPTQILDLEPACTISPDTGQFTFVVYFIIDLLALSKQSNSVNFKSTDFVRGLADGVCESSPFK